jgi:threonine aldolase
LSVQRVDLRSDTVTQPTAAMRAAMMAAPLGDDVFGDDPSVHALQDHAAQLLGHEAALFVTSGTQSNLLALLSHCERGGEYIAGQSAHCYRYEAGGAAVLGGIQPQPVAQFPDGRLDLGEVAAAIKPDDPHFARTRVLCLENTWNGHVLPPGYVDEAVALARHRGLAVHLDGARLFNAAVAQAGPTGDPFAEVRALASRADSVSVCLSKGLGAPVGSLLLGSRSFIARAHRWRKMVGGGLRQSGLLAAAGLHALTHHVHRLAEDHVRAQRLAAGLQGLPGLRVRSAETNIVFVEVDEGRGAALLQSLSEQGILATGLIGLRFVTHLDVDDAGIERTIAALRAFMTAQAPATQPAGASGAGPYGR